MAEGAAKSQQVAEPKGGFIRVVFGIPVGVTFLGLVGLVLALLCRRSATVGSTPIEDYLLTDDADLRWVAWAIDLKPRAKLMMLDRRPDGQFRSVDIREISACFAHDTYDVPKRAPYNGDVDRAIDDLEDRRTKEKRALWQATP